jgi:hypothetical protein
MYRLLNVESEVERKLWINKKMPWTILRQLLFETFLERGEEIHDIYQSWQPELEPGASHLLPSSCWFVACLILRPWWWNRHGPPKRWLTFDVISQKIKFFIITAVGTSDPIWNTIPILAERRLDPYEEDVNHKDQSCTRQFVPSWALGGASWSYLHSCGSDITRLLKAWLLLLASPGLLTLTLQFIKACMHRSTEPNFQRYLHVCNNVQYLANQLILYDSRFCAENIKSTRNGEEVPFHLHSSSPKRVNEFLPNSLLVIYTKAAKT